MKLHQLLAVMFVMALGLAAPVFGEDENKEGAMVTYHSVMTGVT